MRQITGGDIDMHEMPKLRIKRTWDPNEEECDFEQARHRLFDRVDMTVIVEGIGVQNYNDLVKLAERKEYKNKKHLEVWVLPCWPAGG